MRSSISGPAAKASLGPARSTPYDLEAPTSGGRAQLDDGPAESSECPAKSLYREAEADRGMVSRAGASGSEGDKLAVWALFSPASAESF